MMVLSIVIRGLMRSEVCAKLLSLGRHGECRAHQHAEKMCAIVEPTGLPSDASSSMELLLKSFALLFVVWAFLLGHISRLEVN